MARVSIGHQELIRVPYDEHGARVLSQWRDVMDTARPRAIDGLQGLSPDDTSHFRSVGLNENGVSLSVPLTFEWIAASF